MTEMRADLLSQPGSAAYRAATIPHNATVVQRPVMVAHPVRTQEVAQAVQWAAQRNLGGLATDVASRVRTEDGLSKVRAAAIPADIGRSAASFAEGRGAVADGLDHSGLQRLARISAALDPDRRLAPSRLLAALNDTGVIAV